MISPFQTLGVPPWADPEEIRSAYRVLVKQWHPDMMQDPAARQRAQQRMVEINLAYEEALRMSAPRRRPPVVPELHQDDAMMLAESRLSRGKPEEALRQLLRAEGRNAAWYALQGRILMAMRQYESAHQSFREALRLDPDNHEYHRQAFEAESQLRKSRTLPGRVRSLFHRVTGQ